MKINEDVIIQSIKNIVDSHTTSINMFWGLLSLFASVRNNNESIKSQTMYCVNQDNVGFLLTDWFSYRRHNDKLEEKTDKTLYFILASNWSTKLAELMKISSEEVNQPSIVDYAIFFSKNIDFVVNVINMKEVVDNFIESISLSKEDLNNIFNMEFDNKKIDLIDNYEAKQFFEDFKKEFSIENDNTTISFDKRSMTIASHPKELSRAPFIQTLYSGMSIQNIILVSNNNLELSYRFGMSNDVVTKTENSNIIFYGAPGTGKSYVIKEKLKRVPKNNVETVTFHPDYDYTSFVGGYRPVSVEDNIKYQFVPQVFINIYVKAWKNPTEQFYLVIEEINRGNCAEIFGDIFQLLDQNQEYTVTPSNELKDYLIKELSEHLNGISNGLKMPNNLTIFATMNTSDQSLFPMDSAFKRRWDWEYIPINYEKSEDNPSSKFKVFISDNEYFFWLSFIKKVNAEIKSNPNLGMDKCIGNYFIKPEADSITLKMFVNKVMFYLWNDVFKDEFGSESIFAEDVTYEDFFPIEPNGKSQLKTILENLDIKIHTVTDIALNEDTD